MEVLQHFRAVNYTDEPSLGIRTDATQIQLTKAVQIQYRYSAHAIDTNLQHSAVDSIAFAGHYRDTVLTQCSSDIFMHCKQSRYSEDMIMKM